MKLDNINPLVDTAGTCRSKSHFALYYYSLLSFFCTGFAWQGFSSGGATGMASVRSCWKLPVCQIKPVPAGSKTDPSLAKAEPISDSVSASGITELRRGTKLQKERRAR